MKRISLGIKYGESKKQLEEELLKYNIHKFYKFYGFNIKNYHSKNLFLVEVLLKDNTTIQDVFDFGVNYGNYL